MNSTENLTSPKDCDKVEMNVSEEPPPLTPQEKRSFAIKAGSLFVAALVFLGVFGYLCLSGTINLAGASSNKQLETYGEKLEYTMKYFVLTILFLQIYFFVVIGYRGKTGAANPLEGRDIYMQSQKNIFANTVEQVVLSGFAQMVMVAHIDSQYTLRAIPFVNICFLVGRIAFTLGYPNYRTFGILLSALPSATMIGVAFVKLMQHWF